MQFIIENRMALLLILAASAALAWFTYKTSPSSCGCSTRSSPRRREALAAMVMRNKRIKRNPAGRSHDHPAEFCAYLSLKCKQFVKYGQNI